MSRREENVQELKEQMEKEKRDLLLCFAEKEKEGEKLPRKFNMDSELDEMRFWYYKLTRDHTRKEISDLLEKGYELDKDVDLKKSPHHVLTAELRRLQELDTKSLSEKTREEIAAFLKKGFELHKDVDLNTSPPHVLTRELFRLRELEHKRQLLFFAFTGIGLVTQMVCGDSLQRRKINCLECNAENWVNPTNAPLKDSTKICLNCNKEIAQIYQPQCGHVCLCNNCFQETKEKK